MSASPPLAGQTALITGAARRVGAAVARCLHAAGANVVIHHHHSGEEATALAAQLTAARAGSALALKADLLDLSQLSALVAHTVAHFGALHMLVNNASSFYPTPLGRISADQWEDLTGTNLRAPLFLSQAATASLRATHGLIVNVADINGQRPLRDHLVYSVAKAGLIMLTRALARELAPQVRVNAVAPGPVLWPENGIDEAHKQLIIEHTPLGRPGSPDDVARATLFFATAAPYVTGQVLAVDGGRSIGW